MLQQRDALGDRQIRTLPGCGHQAGVKGVEQVLCRRQVFGQRHQGMGTAGKHNHCRLGILARLQQVENLALGVFQTGGLQVGGEHGRGQIKQDYQRVVAR